MRVEWCWWKCSWNGAGWHGDGCNCAEWHGTDGMVQDGMLGWHVFLS